MKSTFSPNWKKSTQPRKQRKWRANAPLHAKQKLLNVHLAKELRTKYHKRSVTIRNGDTVKVMRGQYKGKTGKIDQVDIKRTKVIITGIEQSKKDGTKSFVPFEPSNILITELNLTDKKRVKSIQRK